MRKTKISTQIVRLLAAGGLSASMMLDQAQACAYKIAHVTCHNAVPSHEVEMGGIIHHISETKGTLLSCVSGSKYENGWSDSFTCYWDEIDMVMTIFGAQSTTSPKDGPFTGTNCDTACSG